jgi:hypothetical protein
MSRSIVVLAVSVPLRESVPLVVVHVMSLPIDAGVPKTQLITRCSAVIHAALMVVGRVVSEVVTW